MDRQQQQGMSGGQGGQGAFPLSNPEYDIISIMHNKLQAIEAYQTYLKDTRGSQELTQLIQRCLQQDQQDVQQFHKLLHAFHQQGGQGQSQGQGQTGGMSRTAGT